jgi:hypothetical protein
MVIGDPLNMENSNFTGDMYLKYSYKIINADSNCRYVISGPTQINPSQPSGNYVPLALTTSNTGCCIYWFYMILSINADWL